MLRANSYPGPDVRIPEQRADAFAGQRKREERALRSRTFYPVLSVKQVQDLVKGAGS